MRNTHIPDGIIPFSQSVVYLSISIPVIILSIWMSRKNLKSKQVPIIGVLAAALFAAQMFNFPIVGGSSGHLIGTALATTLVGPWVSILIISSILIIQAIFGDGGILAYGANVFNMAIVGSLVTWVIFYFTPIKWKDNKKGFSILAAVAGFVSTVLMATAASTELVIAGAGNAGLVYGSMLAFHTLIGLVESIITFTVVFFIFRADMSLLKIAKGSLYLSVEEEIKKEKFKIPLWSLFTSLGAFALMSIYGLIASNNPDGLEKTFEKLGIEGYDSTILSFGEGLGFDILIMFIAMIVLFLLLTGLSYGIYRYNLYRTTKKEVGTTV
ncbi:MAG: energy-coupling factor ABC transporter permease [Candidatus Heimdallarchaeaceae archaeon]